MAAADAPSPSSPPAEPGIPHQEWGLAVGALVLLAAFVDVGMFAGHPLLGLLLVVGLGWGLLSAIGWLGSHKLVNPGDGLIIALTPFIVVPTLYQRIAQLTGTQLPTVLTSGLVPLALVLLVALVLVVVARHPRIVRGLPRMAGWPMVAWIGTAWVASLVWGVLALTQPWPAGSLRLLGISALIVAGALLVQRWAARRAGGGVAALFASGPGLLVAMGQLADGVTSYLAVADPLGLLAGGVTEQVALSAWVLEHAGPAYPLLKWLLALGAVYAIEAQGVEKQMGQVARVGLYVVMLLLGFGPAAFSATQLLL